MPMRTELQGQLFRAIYACLRPLARFLLRTGVTYKQFKLWAVDNHARKSQPLVWTP